MRLLGPWVPSFGIPDGSDIDLSVRPFDDSLARSLGGFGPAGIVAFLLVMVGGVAMGPLRAVPALLWTWRSGTPWRDIGYVRPWSWIRSLVVGVAFGAGLKSLMKAIVMPLLGGPPINPAYHYLAGNTAALPGMLFAVTAGAGFGEETPFRGYLFERLGRLLGKRAGARVAIVLPTSVLFGLGHYPQQGLAGVQQALVVGLVLGAVFAVTGRIWMPVFTHAAFDLTAWAEEASRPHAHAHGGGGPAIEAPLMLPTKRAAALPVCTRRAAPRAPGESGA